MKQDELVVLLLLLGVGAAALFMASQPPGAGVLPVQMPRPLPNGRPVPATAYQNAEIWEVRRDPGTQRIIGYNVKRDATIAAA